MNIDLVLSRYGMRGVAHIGAIKTMDEHHIYPTHIAGTSAGTILGVLYVHDYNYDQIFEFFKTLQVVDYKKIYT